MHICGVNCSGVLLNYLWCVTQPADVCIAPGWRHTRAYKFSPCWTYLRSSLMAWERANVCRNSICCNVLSHEDKKEPPASHEKKKKKKKTWGGNRVYARSLFLSESQQQWRQSSQSGGALHTAPMNTLIRVPHWGRQVSSSLPLISKEHCSSCNGSENQTGILKCHSRPANYTGRNESS